MTEEDVRAIVRNEIADDPEDLIGLLVRTVVVNVMKQIGLEDLMRIRDGHDRAN